MDDGARGPVGEDAVYATLGRRVRQLRGQRGLTQGTLATTVGLTRASVANIERGRQKFLVHTLLRLAQALNVGAEKLLVGLEASAETPLESLLQDRPTDERDWIRSMVGGRRKGKNQDGRPAKVRS